MNTPIRLYMTMSLGGFIAGPDDRPGQELGSTGGRLFNWLDDRMSDGASGQEFRESMATGAVISGRRTFELAGRWRVTTTAACRSSSSLITWTRAMCTGQRTVRHRRRSLRRAGPHCGG